VIGLVRTELRDAQVIGLILGERGNLDPEVFQVSLRDLLVQLLGQHVDADLVLAVARPEFDLSQNLIGEGVAHDEGRMTHGTSQVDQTPFGQEDDVFAILERVAVHLGLDVVLDGVGVQPGSVDLAIEMSDVADDGILEHHLKVAAFDDAGAAGGGDEDARFLGGLIHGSNFETLHGRLQGVDGIDLRDQDAGAESAKSLGATFADVTVTGDDGNLASDHDVGGAFDAIDERLAATVEVVKLGFGHRIVDVDGGDLQFSLLVELVEVMDAGGGFLRAALDSGQEMRVLGVDEVGQVAAVIEDHVEGLAIREEDGLLDAPQILLVGHPLPGVDGHTGGSNGGGGVVLSGEDVAARPRDVGAELKERFDEDSRLDGHVEAAGNASTLQRLGGAVFLAEHHEAGHLVLRHVDDFATPFSQADVSHLVRKLLLRSHDECLNVRRQN